MVTEAQIDAGAQVLRDLQQGHRMLRRWVELPKADKRKWREYATAVLNAAEAAR